MTSYDGTQLDSTAIGGVEQTPPAAPFEKPWRLGPVRIDGLEGTPPVFAPNRDVTLSCVFADVLGTGDYQQRHQALRSLIRNGRYVRSWASEGETLFREDHDNPPGSQLALLAPLAPTATGADPEHRPSPFEAMWVVVRGGEDTTRLASTACTLNLDVTCVAPRAEYDSKAAVLSALSVNGYGL